MAKIVINEISQNYSYNIGNNSFAGVALPITACWGPAYQDYKKAGYETECQMREHSAFYRFPATKDGLESFVATFRGPAANYRLAKDYSYQMAMTLLTAGYDVHVCRVSPGDNAKGTFVTGGVYALLDTQPESWSTDYANYYTKSGNSYIPVVGVDAYRLLTEAPSDWAENYANYYTLVDTDYVPVEAVDIYTAVSSGATKPVDWDTTYNTDYYVYDAGTQTYELNTESTWSTAKAIPIYTKSQGAPEFTADTYYEEYQTAPVFAKDTYYELEGGKERTLKISAKYPGTFGNNLRVRLVKSTRQYLNPDTGKRYNYWNLITYIVDNAGVQTSAENLIFVFELDHSTDNIPHISEVVSEFLSIDASNVAVVTDDATFRPGEGADATTNSNDDIRLRGGTDREDTTSKSIVQIMDGIYDGETVTFAGVKALAKARFNPPGTAGGKGGQYLAAIEDRTDQLEDDEDKSTAEMFLYREWCYNAAYSVLDLLKDKLSYNMQAIIMPGWDDQDISDMLGGELMTTPLDNISPLHLKMMEAAYYSRCATAHLDIPRSCLRKYVYVDDGVNGEECDEVGTTIEGYAQKLARFVPDNADYDINTSLYETHSALFAPWRRYTYVGMSRQVDSPPAFLALMIHRAQLLNQTLQYFWALPTNRKQNLRIGKAQYATPGKILKVWQQLEGVGINVVTEIPDVGTTIWGNSTLFEVPPATYQALANLSTRYLVNAVEDIAYRCGIAITFQYNNNQAYNKFYAGVTPTLDTMKNVGAIDDYYIEMSADINGLEQVNANTVIGKIYLVVNGVINDIVIDLIALPPGVDLDQYRS